MITAGIKKGKSMNEETLIEKLKERDPNALELLITQYNKYVCSVIIRTLGDYYCIEDVKELASDVFMAVWEHISALRTGKVKAYIGTIARNKTKDFLRKNHTLNMDLDEILALPGGETPESQFLKKEQDKIVRDAILRMPPLDREIFLRYYYYLQPTAKIATAVDMNESTVRVHLMRGRNKLKQSLLKEGIERI